ncbi:prephenate dehydrogenase [Planctomicrobium piriforme]|uniref:Prephenate dehydrogenase n=2 Tax=Planctomicrobium piriforme TaxID=1576369 RepID=A0A1I3C2S6_9PLAN|nr:prephenate dehydrogenase [Planctomicrobium piriforme]
MAETGSQFDCIAVMGVGLIGGSIALAAKSCGAARSVIGFGRNRDRLAAAKSHGVIDEAATSSDDLSRAGLIVVCTPVDRIATDVLAALQATEGTSTLVTDAGSVKGSIQRAVDLEYSGDRFVAAHPLAGSHHSGFEHANASLLPGRLCVLTPRGYPTVDDNVQQVRRFWERLGMRVRLMSVQEHDKTLALTSHLPHLAASAVASLVEPAILEYASTGYRDTTRVAAGDPELWSAIFALNKPEMLRGIDRLVSALQQCRIALDEERHQDLRGFLQGASEARRQYRDDPSRPDDGT